MAGYFSRLFDPPQSPGFFGPETDPDDAAAGVPLVSSVVGGATVVPVVANFGLQGSSPADTPYWKGLMGFPNADPRMPFFVLPPNTVFNMPIIKQLPGTPYVGKDGRPHLDGWNPWEGRVISPGPGI